MSADWDSNPDPLVSGQVPLPLDHLHSSFSLLFNSYPRALLLCLIQDLDTVHVHCMLRVLWDAHALLSEASCTCTLVIYHHLPNTFLKLLNFINNKYFSLEQFTYSRKSLSTDWDSNPDPLVSSQVPLPLDHLHSCFSLLFNSYPRALLLCPIQDLDTVHAHCMLRVLLDAHAHVLLSEASCACALVIYHHLPNMFLKLFNFINNKYII